MCDGYNAAGNDDRPSLEDEFLCEYVDGTMDPVVQEVFEEYLRSNPDLQEHVECLRSTRLLLCRYACGCHAPNDLHDRLRREISCELMRSRIPFQVALSDRLRPVAAIASTMALVVLALMLTGDTILDSTSRSVAAPASAAMGPKETTQVQFDLSVPLTTSDGPFYPSYSAFAPLSTVRSLLAASEKKTRDDRADSIGVTGMRVASAIP